MGKIKNKLHSLVTNKWFLFAMALIGGYYGIHRFLMGRWVTGILMIIASFCGIGAIWSVIDAVMIALGKLTPRPRRIKNAKRKTKKAPDVQNEDFINYNGPVFVSGNEKTRI